MKQHHVAGLGLLLVLLSGASHAGIMYVVDGDGSSKPQSMFAIDTTTGTVVNAWAPAIAQRTFPIAVWGDVRTTGYASGETGGLYALDGTYQGITYELPAISQTLSDGTSDGSYNYAVSWLNGQVYRFDRDWTNPVLQFDAGIGMGGITYNPADGTFWTSADRGSGIYHYTADGTLLGSFAAVGRMDWNLAFDPTSESLWVSVAGSGGAAGTTFYNYGLDGALLGTLDVAGIDGASFLSAEFNLGPSGNGTAPVAGLPMLLVAGMIGLALSRRRRHIG